MKKIIFKNKIHLLFCLSFLSIIMLIKPSSDELIGNEFKSSILLYFTPQKTEKNQANCHLKVVYLGNEYETTISSHFGGQIRLHDFNLSNKYYVVVSPEVSPLLDNNSCIKGYKINSENIHSSKMYVMNLIITTNSKSEMTYNWNIEEIAVPTRSLPENTIIIYAEPESISFASFNKKFDKTYPNSNESKGVVIILPQIYFNNSIFHQSQKYINNTIGMHHGHKKIFQTNNR